MTRDKKKSNKINCRHKVPQRVTMIQYHVVTRCTAITTTSTETSLTLTTTHLWPQPSTINISTLFAISTAVVCQILCFDFNSCSITQPLKRWIHLQTERVIWTFTHLTQHFCQDPKVINVLSSFTYPPRSTA